MSERFVVNKWNDSRKDWFSVDDLKMEVEICRSADEEQAERVARLLNDAADPREALEISEHKDFLRLAITKRQELLEEASTGPVVLQPPPSKPQAPSE